MKQIQGKQGLVRNIGRFGKPRVREIGIPLYYCFIIVAAGIVLGQGGIVVVCSFVLSKGSKPFMRDLTRAAT